MDDLVSIPGTRRRVGLDPLISLAPVVGDAVGAAFSGYCIMIAARAGAPVSVLLRMLLNTGIDLIVGIVPVVGDVFDFAFKSNRRNLLLLEQYLASPDTTRSSSRFVVASVVIAGAAVLVLAVLGVVMLLRVLSHVLGIPMI
jgi:hypothetical protein